MQHLLVACTLLLLSGCQVIAGLDESRLGDASGDATSTGDGQLAPESSVGDGSTQADGTVADAVVLPGTCTLDEDCGNPANACRSLSCVNSACVEGNAPNGTACNSNACVDDQTCTQGGCAGGSAKDCSAMDSVCAIGRCRPATGACFAAAKAQGTVCGANKVCNGAGACGP